MLLKDLSTAVGEGRMRVFRDFEMTVLEAMTRDIVPPDVLAKLPEEAVKLSYVQGPGGYVLTVLHGAFPQKPMSIDSPKVKGRAAGIASRYSLRFKDGTMAICCDALGIGLPEDYRLRQVEISIEP